MSKKIAHLLEGFSNVAVAEGKLMLSNQGQAAFLESLGGNDTSKAVPLKKYGVRAVSSGVDTKRAESLQRFHDHSKIPEQLKKKKCEELREFLYFLGFPNVRYMSKRTMLEKAAVRIEEIETDAHNVLPGTPKAWKLVVKRLEAELVTEKAAFKAAFSGMDFKQRKTVGIGREVIAPSYNFRTKNYCPIGFNMDASGWCISQFDIHLDVPDKSERVADIQQRYKAGLLSDSERDMLLKEIDDEYEEWETFKSNQGFRNEDEFKFVALLSKQIKKSLARDFEQSVRDIRSNQSVDQCDMDYEEWVKKTEQISKSEAKQNQTTVQWLAEAVVKFVRVGSKVISALAYAVLSLVKFFASKGMQFTKWVMGSPKTARMALFTAIIVKRLLCRKFGQYWYQNKSLSALGELGEFYDVYKDEASKRMVLGVVDTVVSSNQFKERVVGAIGAAGGAIGAGVGGFLAGVSTFGIGAAVGGVGGATAGKALFGGLASWIGGKLVDASVDAVQMLVRVSDISESFTFLIRLIDPRPCIEAFNIAGKEITADLKKLNESEAQRNRTNRAGFAATVRRG